MIDRTTEQLAEFRAKTQHLRTVQDLEKYVREDVLQLAMQSWDRALEAEMSSADDPEAADEALLLLEESLERLEAAVRAVNLDLARVTLS